jgi:dTDP-glucose 4,6-dehydratase
VKYLVTGGAGFIGSNYVRGLLTSKWGTDTTAVTVLDALTYAGRRENLASIDGDPRFKFVQGSINDVNLVAELTQDVDVLVHFAAESHVDRSITSASEFVTTNVLGTQILLDSIKNRNKIRFLHVSTDEVYGSVPSGSSVETDLLLPNSPYAASKASSDLVVRSYFQTYGLDCVTTRCSNNFGQYQFPEKLLPRFITNLIDGKSVPVYGDGLNVRDWLHVDDHCRGIQLAIERGSSGEIYNIGGGTELTNITLTRLLLNEFGLTDDQIEYVPDRLGHDRRYSVNWSKSKTELGYEPQLKLEDGLSHLVSWYKDNETWWRPILSS